MEMSGQFSRPCRFTRETEPPPPSIHLITGWVGPKAGIEVLEKRKIFAFAGVKPQLLGPSFRSYYIIYAIPGTLASII